VSLGGSYIACQPGSLPDLLLKEGPQERDGIQTIPLGDFGDSSTLGNVDTSRLARGLVRGHGGC
jgi:hypothetical protein